MREIILEILDAIGTINYNDLYHLIPDCDEETLNKELTSLRDENLIILRQTEFKFGHYNTHKIINQVCLINSNHNNLRNRS